MKRTRTDYDWQSRLQRAFTQRIYLMESEAMENGSFRFKMMGNTNKPYDISVANGEAISCSCPDHQMWGNFCKHMMHLLIRVIGMTREQVCDHYYKNENFVSGCETMHPLERWFARKESNLNAVGDMDEAEDVEIPGQVKRRPIEEDDDCPVCYEQFSDTANEPTVWCRAGCGKSVHQSCFLKWSQALGQKYGSHKALGCVYCRTEWMWG